MTDEEEDAYYERLAIRGREALRKSCKQLPTWSERCAKTLHDTFEEDLMMYGHSLVKKDKDGNETRVDLKDYKFDTSKYTVIKGHKDPAYRRGYFKACDDLLNTINTIEENGPELRKILYKAVMELRPDA